MSKINTVNYDEVIHTFGMMGYFLAFCINAYLAVNAKQTMLSIYLMISCIGFLSMTIYHIRSLFVSRHLNLPLSAFFTSMQDEKFDPRVSLASQITVCYRFFAHVCLTLFFCLMFFYRTSTDYVYDDIFDFLLSFISHEFFTVKMLVGMKDTPGAVGIIFAQIDRLLAIFTNPTTKQLIVSSSAFCLIMMYSMNIFAEI